jgi:antitoxin VapB
MATARVFKSGNSQAVRLPKEFRVSGSELEIFRRGDELVLREKRRSGEAIYEAALALSEALGGEEPDDPPPEDRPGL